MYFRLKEDCKLVEGAVRGAIYDLASGKVHSVNKGAVELLQACRQEQVEDILLMDDSNRAVYTAFFDKLTRQGLGACYFAESNQPQREITVDKAQLQFLWLELTGKCNNRCLHCYADSGPMENNDAVPHERWLSVISEARREGASAIQLIGGEPLLYPAWRELAVKAYEEGYENIEIFSNGTLITDSDIGFFKKYGIQIATTIYADNSEIHDAVTKHAGSFDKTMAAVRKLLAEKIPLRIASIIMKVNENEAQKIMELCVQLGLEATPPDVVRPSGRGSDTALLPTAYVKPSIKPPFYTNEQSFAEAQQYHSCLAGKVAISSSGDVLPCIFARNMVFGSILRHSLADILSSTHVEACWRTTKDYITKCRDCEYRYACSDFRPLAQGTNPGREWLASSPGCDYNPYTGKWKEANE